MFDNPLYNLIPKEVHMVPDDTLHITKTALFYAISGALYCVKAVEYPRAEFKPAERAVGVVQEVTALFSAVARALSK